MLLAARKVRECEGTELKRLHFAGFINQSLHLGITPKAGAHLKCLHCFLDSKMKAIYKNKWVYGVALVAAGFWYFQGDSSSTSIEYQTGPLTVGDVESVVNTAGTLSPLSIVEVGSEVSGLIVELNVDFNAVVKEGDLLARIDDRDVRVTLRQREADLEVSKANLLQAKANLIKSETDYEFAENELARSRALLERQLISETDLETSLSRVRAAEASLESAKAQIVSAEASILQREAQVEQAQIDLERTQITSPVDGVVINRLVDLGQAVNANQNIPVLFEVAKDLSQMQIEADIGEADIGKVSEGLDVRFSVDAYADQNFVGNVSQVRKAAGNTNNVVTYTIIIDASNPREALLPGMTANVDIVLGAKSDVLRVPNAALRFRPPGADEAEEAGGGGFGGGNVDVAAQAEETGKSIGLEGDKLKQFVAAIEKNTEEIRASVQGNGGGGFDRNAIQNIRAKLTNELRLLLTEEQFTAYQAAASAGRGNGGGRGNANADGLTGSGEVWVMRDGEPALVRVRTGLVDSQYTEIQSNELAEGDQVIVRAIVLADD